MQIATINQNWCTRDIWSFLGVALTITIFTATIIATTSYRQSKLLRIGFFPAIAYLCYALHATAQTAFAKNPIARSEGTAVAFCLFLHCTNLILLEGIGYDDKVISEREEPGVVDVLTRIWRGLTYLPNARGIQTPYQIKNVPQFDERRPGWVPSKQRFLITNTIWLVAEFLLFDFLTAQMMSEEEMSKVMGVNRENLFDRANSVDGPITKDEVGFRTFGTAFFWIVGVRMSVELRYMFYSIVFVGLGISEPKNWPPPFGSWFDAYTLRHFWGKYWHQTLRWCFTTPANFFTHDILRLPRTGVIQRYTNILAVFFLSGTMHTVQELAMGLPWEQSRALRFFTLAGVFIIVEDAIQAIYRKITGTARNTKPSLWHKVVGYVWVWGWFMLFAPIYHYPQIRLRLPPWLPIQITENVLPKST